MSLDPLWRIRHANVALKQAEARLQRALREPEIEHLSGLDRGRVQRAAWDTQKALEELAWVLPEQEEQP